MTLTLDLSREEEARLHQKAADLGLGDVEYVRRLINAEEPRTTALPRTPAEMVAYWEREGLFGLFEGDEDSPELARRLRRDAETREW